MQRRPVIAAGVDAGRFLTGRQLPRGNILGVRWTEFARDDEPEFKGQVGQESNLHPAVVETQSYVSGSVAHHRHMPICPIISVV
jgi:hypothetical protein